MSDSPVRVLLVEDDDDDYLLTRELLLDAGLDWVDIRRVATYDEALAACERQDDFDVCLFDYRLGERNGIELLRELETQGCSLPVIFLTGQGAREVDVEAMRAGAVDYLVKGEFTPAQLERAIRYATETDRSWRELEEALRRLAASREEGRLHLAQELHDGPLQDIYGSLFQLGGLADDAMPDVSIADRLLETQGILRGVIDQLRAICGELRPPALPLGLEVAVRSHVDVVRAANPGLEIELELEPDGQQLPEPTRLALYRICQQALANVVRHASAGQVLVRLSLGPEDVTLDVRDDGVGFVLPDRWVQLARQGHLGLLGARERAEALGGRLEIRSSPSDGTALKAVIPRPAGPPGSETDSVVMGRRPRSWRRGQ